MREHYDAAFFSRMDDWASKSAAVVSPLVQQWLKPTSILDVGGGTGAWTAAFASLGVQDYLCVDGDYVDRNALRVPPDRFREIDVAQPFDLGRRFDLALCLEVAEHLPKHAAESLVRTLARHSDMVLFSAAIPHQGGTNHVNEQWPDYWAKLFKTRGYACYDCLRWKIWPEPTVADWYKQNTFLYLNESAASKLSAATNILESVSSKPCGIVHPNLFLWTVRSLHNARNLEDVPSMSWILRAAVRSATLSVCRRSRMIWSKR